MANITLTIDGDSVAVSTGTTILKAARQLGRHIPTICYHDHCTANGLCRICVVEVNGVKPLVPACLTPVREGIKVSTSSVRAERSRRTILEMLASAVDLSQAPEITGAFPRRSGASIRSSTITRCISAITPSASCAGAVFRCVLTTRSLPTRSTSKAAVLKPASAHSSTSPCLKPAAYFAGSAWGSVPPARSSPSASRSLSRD